MNCGLKAEIIEYNSYSDISVKFENGKIRQHITYKSFLKRGITPEGRIQGRNKLIANSKKNRRNEGNEMRVSVFYNKIYEC